MRRRNLWCMVVLLVALLLGGCGSGSSVSETTVVPAVMDAAEAVNATSEPTAEATETTVLEVSMVEDTLDDGNSTEDVESEKVVDEYFTVGENDLNWPMYSLRDVNEGKLGDKIVFNSIHIQASDYAWHKDTYKEDIPAGTITNESNFVGARENTGINAGANNVWNGDRIKVEEGKEYIVRLYVHNNNPNGEKAIAENTRVSFNIPSTSAREVAVNGYIYSDSASVNGYPHMDNVIFESATGESFHLEYVKDSALLENQADYNTRINSKGEKEIIGFKLSNDIVEAASVKGVKIGYKLGADGQPNGQVPGCYQYDSFVTIKVKPVFDREFTISKKVRVVGAEDQTWKPSVDAKIGDTVEFLIEYTNKSNYTHENVSIWDILPKNLEYIPGTTKLLNAKYPNWATFTDDTITTEGGINIGGYTAGSNAFIMFSAKVIDNSLACGSNTLVNWAQAQAGADGQEVVLQDYARVNVDNEN